jgi:hypothetical protein
VLASYVVFYAKPYTSRSTSTVTSQSSSTNQSTRSNQETNSTTSQTTQSTAPDNDFTTYFYYDISISYNGSWSLMYWGQNGTFTNNETVYCNQCYGNEMSYNVVGNLTGSGNYSYTVTTYGIGYTENNLCVNATKLGDLQQNKVLTLRIIQNTGNTSGSNPTVEVCATQAV